MKIPFKRLTEDAVIPKKGSDGSSGYDLYSTVNGVITEDGPLSMDLGFAVAIPKGYGGFIFARSGLSSSDGVRPATCVSVIDSDYRGSVKLTLHEDRPGKTRQIGYHERVAQLVVIKTEDIEFKEVDELDQTERGSGGLGSTGK